jgi:hypothetical protein
MYREAIKQLELWSQQKASNTARGAASRKNMDYERVW